MKAYPTFHYYHYGKLIEKYESDRTVSGVDWEHQQSARTLQSDRTHRTSSPCWEPGGGHTIANSVPLRFCVVEII